jgi:electron transfer flavoprotein beta subunit
VRIVVPLKAVPDLVEEMELTADGTGIERGYLKFVLNEWDGQALEEALLLKDATGAEVVVVGLADDPEIDQILYTAVAKGADAAIKLVPAGAKSPPGPLGTRLADRAAMLAGYLGGRPADLVITGVQAADDPDGQLPPMLAALLDWPHVSVVVSLEAKEGSVTVRQEFAAGRSHEVEVRTPAVIGVQSARQAPRYAPISRIRQAMQAGGLDEVTICPPKSPAGPVLRSVHLPEAAGRAEMLAGDAREVAEQIAGLLRARGLMTGTTP